MFAGCGVRAVETNELPAAAEKSEGGLDGVVGGMTVIVMLVCTMMQVCCETAAELKVK